MGLTLSGFLQVNATIDVPGLAETPTERPTMKPSSLLFQAVDEGSSRKDELPVNSDIHVFINIFNEE